MRYSDFNNKVESGSNDHKDPKNRQKTTFSVTQKGAIRADAGNTKLRTQNSPEKTPEQHPDTTTNTSGNKVIRKEAKNRKSLNKNAIYSSGAIAYASRARGM